jgi:hypothetical protein
MSEGPIKSDWRRLKLFCLLVFAAGLCACWIIPVRLACTGPSSYYTFGYVCDEYSYAQRIQPLLPGATRNNPVNGIGDHDAVSPYFLEDGVRTAITVLGIDPVAFIWIWRILMPCILAWTLWLLARACVPIRKDGSSAMLSLALSTLAFPMLHVLYDLITPTLPLQGYINRFPTNIEYPLSIFTALVYVRFYIQRNIKSALLLALLGSAMLYLRPYAAIPWGITLAVGLLWPAIRRQVQWRKVWIAGGSVAVLIVPLILVSLHNGRSLAYTETLQRYLSPQYYSVHPHWILYLSLAIALTAGSRLLQRRFRTIAITYALPLFILPFACGHTQFSRELAYDRFAVFYLPALLCIAMLAAGRYAFMPRFRTGFRQTTEKICGLGLVAALALTIENSLYKFESYPFGPFLAIKQELPCVTAYQWLSEHTPPDALILADDGFDWRVPSNERQVAIVWQEVFLGHEDLFSIVSRRKRLYSSRLYGNILSNDDELKLRAIYLGTFGVKVNKDRFMAAFREFTPDYILWRKEAGVGRGYGADLRPICEVVHSDENCEIWKLDRTKLNSIAPP